MDFQKNFLNLLKSSTALTKSVSFMDYLPKSVETPCCAIEENLPYLQAYRNISCTYPYHYIISDLSSYCLLYTENGSGTLTLNNQTHSLTAGTLALIDCKELHKLEIKQTNWDYKVFFMNGKSLSFLYKTITEEAPVITLSAGSSVPNMIQKLFLLIEKKDRNAQKTSIIPSTSNAQNDFLCSKIILDILFEIILENSRLTDEHSSIPSYLTQIKNEFDTNYQKNYSLDILEQEYRISRYRICREFTKHFDMPPIQYLNNKRINVAKETLVQTDKRINEIGQMVGFENTNHFIRLFKKQTGVTPLEYRKQPPVQKVFFN